MSSHALSRWESQRSSNIDELLAAHATVGGTGRGRRWRTAQLNRSLVLVLAAEFQGFARELHDAAVATFARWSAGGNEALERVLEVRLTEGRLLDRGNAQPGSLGSDYGRLGMTLWPSLTQRNNAVPTYQEHLAAVNEARNAIAHADEAKLGLLRQTGYPLTLTTFRTWRRSLTALASTLDAEVAGHLSQLFGRPAPW